MNLTTVKIAIRKSPRGWSVQTEVKYPDFTHPAHTSSGATTLASALWGNLDPVSYVANAQIVSLSVNDVPMPFADAYARIYKALSGGGLDYALPRYHKFLLEDNAQ